MNSVDVFHKHLDACKQCRDQPFNLCPIGGKAIKAAASELDEDQLPGVDHVSRRSGHESD